MSQRILVWDLPTRVFHWSLALSFLGAYLSSESERYQAIHLALGYIFLGLIVFRLIWGFIGTTYARFSNFSFSPTTVVQYLQGLAQKKVQHYVGHNPAGAMAIFLLLGLGLAIGVSGVVLEWEWLENLEDFFAETHEITANLMVVIVFAHIAGVILSSYLHQENLARSMFTGYKQGAAEMGISQPYTWLGIGLFALMLAFLISYLI